MQWLIDLIKEWVIAQGYATQAWVLEQLCTSTCRVYRSGNQSVPNGVWTKIQFNAENWDVNSEFTSYKFTAKEAGYFQVNLGAMGVSIDATRRFQIAIYKNGAIYDQTVNRAVVDGFAGTYIADMVYLNGSGDYIEGFVFHDNSAARDVFGHTVYTFMSIHQLSKDSWL